MGPRLYNVGAKGRELLEFIVGGLEGCGCRIKEATRPEVKDDER